MKGINVNQGWCESEWVANVNDDDKRCILPSSQQHLLMINYWWWLCWEGAKKGCKRSQRV